MIAHPYQGKNTTFDHLLGLMILQIINKLPRLQGRIFFPNFLIQKSSEIFHKNIAKLVEFILEKQNFRKQIPVFLSQKQQKIVLKKSDYKS